MKLLLLVCACAVVASGATARKKEDSKRFIDIVANFFSSAAETVRDGVVDAAHAVADAAETAVDAVGDFAETAAGEIADAANTAVDAVGDFAESAASDIVDAANTVVDGVSSFASEASRVLGPILDQVADTVGPIAQNILDAAVQRLIEEAPEILAQLGQMGVEQLATYLLTSAAGKRDLTTDLQSLKLTFRHYVEEGMNVTVGQVHSAVAAVDKFNAMLKRQVQQLESAIHAGQNIETAARRFFLPVMGDVRPLIDSQAFDMDINRFDSVVPEAIRLFGERLTALSQNDQKRGVLMDLAQGALGLLRLGQAEVNQLVSIVDSLAQGLLAPTVSNAKMVAQSLLDNSEAMTSQLLSQAMALLSPFSQQLRPLMQQLQTVARDLGLEHLPRRD